MNNITNVSIKDVVKNPANALELMCRGLEHQSKRADFKVDMDTFGSVTKDEVCSGCAATCALQEILGTNFNSLNILTETKRAFALNVNVGELSHFEMAIDQVRMGAVTHLFEFFNIAVEGYTENDEVLLILLGDSLLDDIAEVRKYIAEMIKLNRENEALENWSII